MEKEFLEWFETTDEYKLNCSYVDAERMAYSAWLKSKKHAYVKAKKLLLAANNWVKITSNEDYTEIIEKAFKILEQSK